MAYSIRVVANIDWIPEGAGPQTVPNAQTLAYVIGSQPAAGHAAIQVTESTIGTVTAAQINTACTAVGSALAAQFGTISLAAIQAFSTGVGG